MVSNLYSLFATSFIFKYCRRFIEFFHQVKREDNVISVIYRLVKEYKIKITKTTIIEYLKSDTNYPSLKSICDFFNEMNILNFALKIDESDLYIIDEPFIAHIKESGGKVLLIYSINNNRVVYADTLRAKKTMNTCQFLENWDGVVIGIESTKLSGETDFDEKRKNEIIKRSILPSTILVISMSVVFGIYTGKSFSTGYPDISLYFILTHFLGLFFSSLIIGRELKLKTKLTDKLCNIMSNADCDAVTNSKASKVFGIITWADVGIVYFVGGLITLFIFSFTSSLNAFSAIAIAALPYPVFSIFYQRLRIRKWCPLCLSVQVIIILESFMALNILNINELNFISFFQIFIIFILVFLVELLLKLLYISDKEKEQLKLDTLKIKRDSEVFLYKLKRGKRIDILNTNQALVFGDIQSKVLISIFLSFHCTACAKLFNSVFSVIERNFKLKIQLVFSPPGDEISTTLLKIIIGFNKSGQNKIALELLKSWYNAEKKAKTSLLKSYNINSTQVDLDDHIKYNSSLFQLGKVSMVPSVYIYGFPMPEPYSIEDLSYQITKLEQLSIE